MFCCALLCVHSISAIILMGKRKRAVCFALFFFLVSRNSCVGLSRVCLQLVIVVFPIILTIFTSIYLEFLLRCVGMSVNG